MTGVQTCALPICLTKMEHDIMMDSSLMMIVFMVNAEDYTHAEYDILKKEYREALDLLLYNIIHDSDKDDEVGEEADSLLSYGITYDGHSVRAFFGFCDMVKFVMYLFRYTYAKE